MKVYKPGDTVWFQYEDGSKSWGEVVDLYLRADEDGPDAYDIVRGDDGVSLRIDADQVIDLDDVSRQAAEALDRWHAEDRRKADLLSELLGSLSFYAGSSGMIRYRNSYSKTWEVIPVSEIVEKYRTLRDAPPQPAPAKCRYGYEGCLEPHEPGESQCSCGCLNHPADHDPYSR